MKRVTINYESAVGKNVMVYYNLRLKCWSVLHFGKLYFHTDYIILSNVKFKVYESQRQTVIRNRVKNVHAYVIGNVLSADQNIYEYQNNMQIIYNPYKYSSFVIKDTLVPIYDTDKVIMAEGKVYLS